MDDNPWAPPTLSRPPVAAREPEASTSKHVSAPENDSHSQATEAIQESFESVSLSPERSRPPSSLSNGKAVAATSSSNLPAANSSSSLPATNGQDAVLSQPTAAPKTPSTKATSKSLAKSKAAPALLDKVVSRTRQRDLPPKPKDEDNKHLAEYTTMLVQSKAMEARRTSLADLQRQKKEQLMLNHLPTWEKEILPNWKAARNNEALKKIWFSGSMPARYRSNLWSACIGNSLMVGKSSYVKSLALANSLLKSDRFPAADLQQLEEDLEQTLPQLKLFQTDGPMYEDLRNLCLAYSVFWKEKPRYSQGISWVAGMLLISMPIQDAFIALVNLISNTFLQHFYDGTQDYIDAYDRIFGTLLADHMPKVYHNFIAHDIRPSLYLHPWLTTVYAYHLPIDCATRIMDILVLEGESFLFRVGLAVLSTIEARLFNPEQEGLKAVFQGTDRGARAVVAREKGKLESQVWPDEVYTQVGASEEAIFGVIDSMVWRPQLWSRLIERELP